MKSTDLIKLFRQMYEEHWSYVLGSAKQGCVDCSGAFVYAYKKFGETIEHGSNSIARKRISGNLLPVSQAKPGYAAFKCKEWSGDQSGNGWYGKAPGDLYHIGLVAEDGKSVYNAKGAAYGFCKDPLEKWSYVAPLKAVTYDETNVQEGTTMEKIRVTADNVNVRSAAKRGDNVIFRANKGDEFELLDDSISEFWQVSNGSKTGYIAYQYLERIEDDEAPVEEHTESSSEGYLVINDADGNTYLVKPPYTVTIGGDD